MLPGDIKKFFPKILQDNIDDSGTALIAKLNTYIALWKADILGIGNFKDPVKCPANLLDEWNYFLQAGFKSFDTETQKRKKIYNAIASHKKRTLWVDDVKPRCDALTGKSASLWHNTATNDFVFIGDTIANWSAKNWATFYGDGTSTTLGMWFNGDSTGDEVAGVVLIDLGYSWSDVVYIRNDDSIICGNGSLELLYYSTIGYSVADIDLGMYIPCYADDIYKPAILTIITNLIIELADHVPAYYRVFLGFTGIDGKFVTLGEV